MYLSWRQALRHLPRRSLRRCPSQQPSQRQGQRRPPFCGGCTAAWAAAAGLPRRTQCAPSSPVGIIFQFVFKQLLFLHPTFRYGVLSGGGSLRSVCQIGSSGHMQTGKLNVLREYRWLTISLGTEPPHEARRHQEMIYHVCMNKLPHPIVHFYYHHQLSCQVRICGGKEEGGGGGKGRCGV